MRHWVTGCPHFNHNNIIDYSKRPFSSAEEMDAHLIENINKCAKKNDKIYMLGDFLFGSKEPAEFQNLAKAYLNRIECKNIILIRGNHDPKIRHRDKREQRRAYLFESLFKEVHSLLEEKIHGQDFTFCHYAMARWDKSHYGAFNCYSHSHSGIEAWMDSVMPGRRSIDCGVDNARKVLGDYRPFSIEEDIQSIIQSNPGFGVIRTHDQ